MLGEVLLAQQGVELLVQQGVELRAQQVGLWGELLGLLVSWSLPEVISLQISEEALCKATARIPLLNIGNHCRKQIQSEAIESKDVKEGTVMLIGNHSSHHSMSKNYLTHLLMTHIP